MPYPRRSLEAETPSMPAADRLGVQSQRVVSWIDEEAFWLLGPCFADEFVGREAVQGLEAPGSCARPGHWSRDGWAWSGDARCRALGSAGRTCGSCSAPSGRCVGRAGSKTGRHCRSRRCGYCRAQRRSGLPGRRLAGRRAPAPHSGAACRLAWSASWAKANFEVRSIATRR